MKKSLIMKQFNLDTWLKDKSRKVVTRRGNPVRIICFDRKHGEDNLPIVFLEQCNNGEFLLTCRKDGRSDTYDTPYDLFFADKEEKLTKFEKAMIQFSHERDSLIKYGNDSSVNRCTHRYSKELINLARKEILKDLPKWKKATEHKEFEVHVCAMDEYMYPYLDTEVNEGEYYIELSDLKTLPKEE